MPSAGKTLTDNLIFLRMCYFSYNTAPLSAPLNTSVYEVGSTFALLGWSPPPANKQNGVIRYYRIYLEYSSQTHINLTTSGSEERLLLNSLEPDSNYTFTVAAVTVLPGPASDPVFFTTNSSGTASL